MSDAVMEDLLSLRRAIEKRDAEIARLTAERDAGAKLLARQTDRVREAETQLMVVTREREACIAACRQDGDLVAVFLELSRSLEATIAATIAERDALRDDASRFIEMREHETMCTTLDPRWVTARLLDRFTLRAFDLFVRCRARLRRCAAPACGQLFVAHKRQIFCSTRCSQRVRTAKWRAAHLSEFRASRRAAYEKRQKKKFGEKGQAGIPTCGMH